MIIFRYAAATLCFSLFTFFGFSQNTQTKSDSDSPLNLKRIKVVEVIMRFPELKENNLWEIYEQHLTKHKKFRCSFLTLNNLARAAAIVNSNEAYDCINSMLVYQENDQTLKAIYFKEITEVLSVSDMPQVLQMQESAAAQLYEQYNLDHSCNWLYSKASISCGIELERTKNQHRH